MWIIELLGWVLIVFAVVCVALVWRRLRRLRAGGVDVALRWRVDDSARGWKIGVGRYNGSSFSWYRVLSIRGGPTRRLHRSALEVVARRDATDAESYTLPLDATVLRCRVEGRELELAMGPGALTGFLSWLESSPPGRSTPWAL